MPGTYRYSATFDRTYEEETPPSSDSRSRPKTRQPSCGRSLSDYGCPRRSTSTDSLDSMCGSSCSSTSHSRQVSTDSTEHIPTRMITKASARPAHNPMQFVKVASGSLYRPQEKKEKVKEKVKDSEEEWQLNLDSWKSRRRKQSEGSLQRLEEIRRIQLEEEERQLEQKKVRTKTFSEMMEERAQRPKQYNLVILGRPISEDEMKSDDEISGAKSDTNEDIDKTSNEEISSNNAIKNNSHNGRHIENGINNNREKSIHDKNTTERTNGGYSNIDSGLDSLSSSHKTGDIADSASDFSQDSGSSLDSDFPHNTGSLTTGVELLEEFSSTPLSNYERTTDDGMELFLRIWLKQGNESKEFGFTLKEGKDQNAPIVSSVLSGGVGDLAGLRKDDQVLAINGEYTQGHDYEVIQFALQQAIFVGHLDLLIWRSTVKDTKGDSNGTDRERSNSLISRRKSTFENGAQDKKGIQKTTKDIRPATDFKEKVSSFERRSSVEHNSSLISKSHPSRKPPPVPNKPRLRSKSVPDSNFFTETNGDYKTLSDNDSTDIDERETSKKNLDVEANYISECSNDLDESSVNIQKNSDSGLELNNEVNESNEKSNVNISDDQNNSDGKVYPASAKCDEVSQPQRLVNLNPIYQDSGLNIIYDSHPPQNIQNIEEREDLYLNNEQLSETILQSEDKKPRLNSTENENASKKTAKENQSHSAQSSSIQDINNEQNQEDFLKLQYDLLNSDIYNLPLNLNQDDILLADLDASPRQLEPPKEKPPPPPLDVSDVECSEKLPTVRHNSTKEIKRELWKRRSNFLGIEFEDGIIEVDENQIPPPLAMEDILKSERELEREKRQLLEEQTLLRLRRLAEEEEIARKEREIIESIEREERERQQQELEREGNSNVNEEASSEKIETNRELKKQPSEISLQDKQLDRFKEEQVLQEREEYVKQQEVMKTLKCANGSKQSNSINTSLSPNLSSKTKSEEVKTDSVLPNRTPSKKMILRQERERLRREQEALQKQREEYERQVKLQQQKWLQQQNTPKQKPNNSAALLQDKVPNKKSLTHENATSNQVKDELWERDEIIYASRQPQAAPPQSDDLKSKNEGKEPSNSKMPLQSQALSKRSLHNLGAAPKAKIVNNEKWIKPNEKVIKRRTEAAVESGYNQYHWLVQEAEMRRITEQKERQCQFASEHRPIHSRSSGLPLNLQSQTNMLHHNNQKQPLNHLTHSALPCGYSVDHPWNRKNTTSNGRHNGHSPDNKQCFGYSKSHRDISPTKPPRSRNTNNQEHLLSVSGRKRCSHCGEELGRGAAMIIESLQLFYHIQCFCCCVCQAQLGNGSCGTDVRVRNNKLHCQHCYSNDEAGLKFSQV